MATKSNRATVSTLVAVLPPGIWRLARGGVLAIAIASCPTSALADAAEESHAQPLVSGQTVGSPDVTAMKAVAATAFLDSLSAGERAWLHEHPAIRVAQDPSWPPIEFTDDRGMPSGMTADFLSLVEERLGVKFQRVKNLCWQEA